MGMRLHARLPFWIKPPCQLQCAIQVESVDTYYLMQLEVWATLHLTCQRCMREFVYDYHQQNVIAVCADEQTADRLMSTYDCMLHLGGMLQLDDVLTDELYLFAPEKHLDEALCQLG